MTHTVNLLSILESITAITERIQTATDPAGDHGRKVTLAELGEIALALAKAFAQVGTMIAGGHHE